MSTISPKTFTDAYIGKTKSDSYLIIVYAYFVYFSFFVKENGIWSLIG